MHRDHLTQLRRVCCGLLVLWGLAGCKEDPCEDRACGQGTCVEGNCLCDTGFEGAQCETASRDKYISVFWNNNILCQQTGSNYQAASVVADPDTDTGVILLGLNAAGDSVFAIANLDTLHIPEQVYGVDYIEGAGLYSDDAFSIEYTLRTTTGQTTECVAVFSH